MPVVSLHPGCVAPIPPQRTSPVARDVADGRDAVGGVGPKFTHVADLHRGRGLVDTPKEIVDSAPRNESRTTQAVLRASGLRARSHEGGATPAPALVRQANLSYRQGCAEVNNTALDLYHVPKGSPEPFVTCDLALVLDWENWRKHLRRAVAPSRSLGQAFGADCRIHLHQATGSRGRDKVRSTGPCRCGKRSWAFWSKGVFPEHRTGPLQRQTECEMVLTDVRCRCLFDGDPR